MTSYKVQDEQRNTISTHDSEAAAITAAEAIEGSRVVMHEVSGTYESDTVVWPAVGATYSR